MKSNCLIQALKAKIKNPSVKIFCISPKINRGHLHFFWTDDKYVYHYENKNENSNSIWFNGKIKKTKKETFEASILHLLNFRVSDYMGIIKIAKKLKLNSVYEIGFTQWAIYSPEFDCNDLPKKNKICNSIMIIDGANINVCKITDFEPPKNKDCCIHWKYISPYCEEYRLFNSDIR